MADNADNQDKKGPKDVTPNPLEQATAKNQPPPQAQAASPAPGEQAEGVAEPPVEQPKPEEPPKALKRIFFNSITWNRTAQLILIVAGVFALILSISMKAFIPLPATIGALLLALAAFFDSYILKKFHKDAGKLQITLRYILTGVLGIMAVVFAIQLAKPYSREMNNNLMMFAFLITLIVVIINFVLYLQKNKNAALADIYLFVSFVAVVMAFYIFRYFYVVPAMTLALAGAILLSMSLSKEHLHDDEKFPIKILGIILILLFLAPIVYYVMTIFFTPQVNVMEYTTISPDYSNRPENLAWSGDNKSLVFNVYSKKKKMGIISIINALSAGTAELPPEGDTKLKLPEFIDSPQWNKASNFIILTGGNTETGPRNVWGISLALSKMQQPLKNNKNKENSMRLLVSDIKKIIDVECMPLTHKTAWASDSKNFVFAAKTKKDGVFNLWTSDINRQLITPITKGFKKIFPLWSPAEDKILYVSKTDSYSYLKISNYNGSNAHEFNPGKKSDRELLPCWDPNESKVIFLAKGRELMIMNANATKKAKLTRETFTPKDYWLSPERKKLKINFTETGDIWRVWTIEKNGKHNKEIFKQSCSGFSQPKWSYDGNTIALNANYGESNSIWIFGKNGEIPLKIYTSPDKISFLEWSPSSKKLAFLVKKFLKQELWVINSDGTKPKKLYSTFGDIGNVSWDNDDKRLVFDETFSHILFVPEITTAKIVHSRTGEVWRLLPYNFYSKYPAWSEKGDMIAYIGWKEIWLPSTGYKIWIARLQ